MRRHGHNAALFAMDQTRMESSGMPSRWGRIFLPFALGYYLSYLLRTVNAVISPALTASTTTPIFFIRASMERLEQAFWA